MKSENKRRSVEEIDLYQYRQGTLHTTVVVRRTAQAGTPLHHPSRVYRCYHTTCERVPERTISLASLQRLNRVLGELYETGRLEGYSWVCPYDETVNGHMRVREPRQ